MCAKTASFLMPVLLLLCLFRQLRHTLKSSYKSKMPENFPAWSFAGALLFGFGALWSYKSAVKFEKLSKDKEDKQDSVVITDFEVGKLQGMAEFCTYTSYLSGLLSVGCIINAFRG